MNRPLEHDDEANEATGATDASPDEMKRREREWDARNDPMALWPGLNAAALQPAADAIGRAVAEMLRGEHASLATDGQYDLRAVGVAALISGTGPLLGYWIERGQLDAPDDVARLLGQHLAHGRQRAERIRLGMLPLLTRFVDAGLTPTALKGFHTAYEYFPDPGTRPSADVDILVPPEQIPRAVALLRESEFVSARDVAGPYKRNWAPPDDPEARIASFERWDARSRWKLELHEGLLFEHLIANKVTLDMDRDATRESTRLGLPLRVLRQPLLTVMLAVHASGELANMRLLRLVEQTMVIRQDSAAGLLDWAEVEELLNRTRTLRFAYPAFALVERLAPGTIDGGLLARARGASTKRARLVTDRFSPTAPILSQHASVTEKLMWTDTPWRTLYRLYEMVSPPRDQPWPVVLKTYHDRLTRILAGKFVVRAAPSLPSDKPRR
jgi:hypothetical protein